MAIQHENERNGKSKNMAEIILYGAGLRGKFTESLLYNHGLFIKGFCDSVKEGRYLCDGGREYPILKFEDIIGKDYQIVVTMYNKCDIKQVTEMLENKKITVITLEDLIGIPGDRVAYHRSYIANHHITQMDKYYKNSESEASLAIFWASDSIFYQMFCFLNLTNVVELACGRGRHVPQYIKDASHITLVDILEKNILYCRERFKNENKISYYINNGYDLQKLESENYTSLFTYDAMVHFESLDVFNYLREIYRILKKGGKALFHHSNNTEDYRVSFETGRQGRSYMSADLFAHFADRAGLKVIQQHILNWGKDKELDCLTLVEK